jgi:hypothetical protein
MSTAATHQTARLAAGSHEGPHDGVCVMELASMLAGEPFGDRPKAVCPALGAFLRTYNDGVDVDRRQDLYGIAARAVGTAGGRRVRRERLALCRERQLQLEGRAPTRMERLMGATSRRAAPSACATLFAERGDHAAALAFIDELIAAGTPAAWPERLRAPDAVPAHGEGTGRPEPARDRGLR